MIIIINCIMWKLKGFYTSWNKLLELNLFAFIAQNFMDKGRTTQSIGTT